MAEIFEGPNLPSEMMKVCRVLCKIILNLITGILNGKADHFKYNDTAMECNGLDLYDGKMKVNDIYRGQYSTELYTNKTIDIVRKHDNTKV